MAEAWANELAPDIMEPYSAGTDEYHEVKPLAVKVMEEIGVEMKKYNPKLLSELPEKIDVLITMGCNVKCPYIPCGYSEDWGIDDPSGKSIEEYRKARDDIKMKIMDLKSKLEKGVFPNEIDLEI